MAVPLKDGTLRKVAALPAPRCMRYADDARSATSPERKDTIAAKRCLRTHAALVSAGAAAARLQAPRATHGKETKRATGGSGASVAMFTARDDGDDSLLRA